ncbi:MAG TPA: hypothetical protein VFT22_26670 [Kofleriaceae bacterium]|nr:hypothetical protein [Kofleriaceae bacterium]
MSAGALATAPDAIAFEIVDVLGVAALVRRSATLGGSVPVRVARACVPLLEGNAWGHQIALRHRIELRARLGRWSAVAPARDVAELDRLVRASVPMLVRDGTLRDGAWRARLEAGLVVTGRTISVFTGLFARPRPGVRLRQSSTANRRAWSYAIAEAILDDPGALCPIVLEVVPAPGATSIALEGEIATLAALPASVAFDRADLGGDARADQVAAAHARFYDAEYFATKRRGAVARKYRDQVARGDDRDPGRAASTEALVVHAGSPEPLITPAPPPRFHRPAGPCRAPAGTPPDRLVVTNAVALTATFDGAHVVVEPDPAELAAYARRVRACWEPWLARAPGGPGGPGGPKGHDGALLYLSKYVTPHPPGEPHFFVKPCALVRTAPGVSTVIDGVCGDGYDILRGVVRTDAFHAAPAVFQLWRPGARITVPRGAPLAQLFPSPRALCDAGFASATGGTAAAWTP